MSIFKDSWMAEDLEQEYMAIGYYRLSKEAWNKGAKNESDSISNQRKLVHSFVSNHPNITLVGEEYDDGYTGTNYERPGFCAILDKIRAGEANCVIVKDLSRLGREYIETGKYLETIFPELGVRFIAINDDVDSENSSRGDDLIIPIKNIMNESYCRELSKKLRRQFQIQRSNGEFMGAFASFGYLKSPDDKHKLIIDECAAEVVKSIFSLKVKGMSQQAIADFLNDNGILPPSEYKKSQGLHYRTGFQSGSMGKWSAVTIRGILTNPLYIGTLVQGKRGTPNYKVKKMRVRRPEDWVVVEENHEAIIDPLMFSVVQKMLERDTRTCPTEDTVLPLAGVLFCADCKSSMCRRSVTRSGKKFYYYVCGTNKYRKSCSSHSFEQKKLESVVLHAINNQVRIVIEMGQLLREVNQKDLANVRIKHLDLMIAQKEKDVDSYQEFRMKLYEALRDELIDRDEYEKMRKKYTQMIEEAQLVLDLWRKERQEACSDTNRDDSWIAQFSKFNGLKELTREAVVTLIDRIEIFEDKQIRVVFNYRNEIAYYQELIEQAKRRLVRNGSKKQSTRKNRTGSCNRNTLSGGLI